MKDKSRGRGIAIKVIHLPYVGLLRVVILNKLDKTIDDIREFDMSKRGSKTTVSRIVQNALNEKKIVELHTPPW